MYIGMGYVNANILGYLIGLFVSFTLNSQWTFKRRINSSVCSLFFSVLRFLFAFMVAWLTNYLFLIFSIKFFNLSKYIAQIGALVTYSIVFFFLCQIFVFQKTNRGYSDEYK